ncbi:tail fiber domain-containing protein [Flavobacterium sp. ZB4P13]|uniref:tail fiber domain-containing protein n=1 Tax=Flavobacterium sp. ZB4P13 TaxID=3401728 RepID=UPI003AAD54E1
MKKLLLLFIVLAQTAMFAQNTHVIEKTMKLSKAERGVKNDSLLVWQGLSKLVKHLPVSEIKTNLDYLATPTDGTVFSSTGNDAILPLATTTNAGLLSPSEKIKLSELQTELDSKVDKVTGKSLLSDAEISRLATLENYTHPANHPPSIISQDANNQFVTATEKEAWNAKQNALGFTTENVANKGIADGYAGLDWTGKVPLAQINDVLLGSVNYKGTYNASTGTPALATATGSNKGQYYKVSTAGTQYGLAFKGGDWIISDGTIWDKVDNNNAVVSVNNQTGVVSLTTANIPDSTNKRYQTDAQQANNDATSPMQAQLNGKQPVGSYVLTSDSRLSDARPASDVWSWAKLSTKPTYTYSEVGAEPAFSKNTAFNKNFGASAGTVAEGNDSRISNGQTAFGWGNHSGIYQPLENQRLSTSNAVSFNRLELNGITNSPKEIYFKTNNVIRFDLGTTSDTESGSNTGSNFNLFRYADNGNYLGTVFSVNRASGILNFTENVPTILGNNIISNNGGTWGINISGNASSATIWNGEGYNGTSLAIAPTAIMGKYSGEWRPTTIGGLQSFLGLGSNAYTSTPYVPLASSNSIDTWSGVNGFYGSYSSSTGMPTSYNYWTGIRAVLPNDSSHGFDMVNPINADEWYLRRRLSGAFYNWRKIWHDGNFNPANYLPLTGGILSGNLQIEGGYAISSVYGANRADLRLTHSSAAANSKTMILSSENGVTRFWSLNDAGNGAVKDNILNMNHATGNTSASGTLTATGFFNSSDRRLKTILKRDGDVAYFKWKGKRDTKTHIGYIAQEVKKEFPDQVQKGEDGMLSVNYVEVMVAKIQDLEKRLQSITKKIKDLEKRKANIRKKK